MEHHGGTNMFYQVADSDTTFIVAIAIIAGIVVVFMAIATLILRRSEHKKDKPVPPIDQPQSIPSVAIMVASPPRESEEGALPSVPSVAIATAFAQVEG